MLCNGWTSTNVQKKRMASKGVCVCVCVRVRVCVFGSNSTLEGVENTFFLK